MHLASFSQWHSNFELITSGSYEKILKACHLQSDMMLTRGRAIWTQSDAEIFLVLRLPRRPKAAWKRVGVNRGQGVGDFHVQIPYYSGHLMDHLSLVFVIIFI